MGERNIIPRNLINTHQTLGILKKGV